jgi:hypothetical protein
MTLNASMDTENQIFDMTNIRGVSGANTLSIRGSGTIIIDNTIDHDTDIEPYTAVLSDQSININSARE